MRLQHAILFFLVFLTSFSVFSQEKIEREVKLKPSQFPTPARQWLADAFEDLKKPKWYLEYSQTGKVFEAKFLWKKYFYSVEFDSVGRLQDVEIEISSSEIPAESWKQIQRYFSEEFKEVSIQKIQRQLIGSESEVEDFFDENESEGITIRFEIVFEGKNETWQVWEGLFDELGFLISVIKVQPRPTDNLVF